MQGKGVHKVQNLAYKEIDLGGPYATGGPFGYSFIVRGRDHDAKSSALYAGTRKRCETTVSEERRGKGRREQKERSFFNEWIREEGK